MSKKIINSLMIGVNTLKFTRLLLYSRYFAMPDSLSEIQFWTLPGQTTKQRDDIRSVEVSGVPSEGIEFGL